MGRKGRERKGKEERRERESEREREIERERERQRERGKKKGKANGQWKRSRTSVIARIVTDLPTPIHLPHLMTHLTARKKVQDATAGADSPATDGSAHSEAKGDTSFTLAQIKERMRFAKERAAPPRTPSNNSNHNTKPPRNVFANIVTQLLSRIWMRCKTRDEKFYLGSMTNLKRPRKFTV